MASETVCIQVRCFIPTMGLYKGMLMKKKMRDNISSPIQLPESMKKVEPSVGSEDNKAMMIICQAGIDPSKHNSYIGRLPSINGDARPPPEKSFQPKEMSTMIYRLLTALNVPKEVLNEYKKNCKARVDEIGHTFVRGVADPTDSLLPGYCFLTGVKNKNTLGDELFVTRSPCIKKTDGKMLKVVTKKPEAMSDEDFEFLQSLSFGTIIFAFPNDGMKAIPELIANGDLDGDRYFVCWNKEILEHIQAEPFVEEVSCEISKKEVKEEATIKTDCDKKLSVNRDWFQLAQERMADMSIIDLDELIGKLYNASEKAANNDKLGMESKDAQSFADAYYQALDSAKHGNKIVLPVHLHKTLPEYLQKYICVS